MHAGLRSEKPPKPGSFSGFIGILTILRFYLNDLDLRQVAGAKS